MTESETTHHPDFDRYATKKFPYNRTVDEDGRVFREFDTAEELYAYLQALLDAGYDVTVGWHNTYKRGGYEAQSKTMYTEIEPEWLGIIEGHEEQVRARKYGWLTPSKVSHVIIEPRDDEH